MPDAIAFREAKNKAGKTRSGLAGLFQFGMP